MMTNAFSLRLSLAFVLLAVAGPLLAAPAKSDKKAQAQTGNKAALRVDSSPVGATAKPGQVTSYADVLEPVQKAVVSVYPTRIIKERIAIHPFLRQFFGNIPDQERESRQSGLGSGVIVTADGYILTNNHVVEGADEVKVTLDDDRDFVARVVGTDPKTDVAVLKIDGKDLPTVVLADSDQLRVGDVVFAVGNPLGIGQTVTMGIVSAKGRSKLGLLENVHGYENFIQTDAAINMGNSGGALVDARGRLIGINSAIITPSRGNIGIGLAIPINLASFILNSLVETGAVARGSLGAGGDTLAPDVAEQLDLPRETRGVVVTEVDEGGPAEKAGLKRADVIVGINDQAVTSREQLRLMIAQMVPESKATLKIMRGGKPRSLPVTLGKVVENPNELFAGIDVGPLTPELRRSLRLMDQRIRGLVVTNVAKDSPYRDQLVRNMVILQINRVPVEDLRAAREQLQPGQNLLTIYHRGQIQLLVMNPQ